MPPPLGEPGAHDGHVFGRVEGMLRLVTRSVAKEAGSHDVRCDVLATIASSFNMLGRASKPLRETGRNSIALDELLRCGVPHR